MRMLPLPRHGKRGQTHAARILLLLLAQAGGELVDLGQVAAQALAQHGDADAAPWLLPGQEGGGWAKAAGRGSTPPVVRGPRGGQWGGFRVRRAMTHRRRNNLLTIIEYVIQII